MSVAWPMAWAANGPAIAFVGVLLGSLGIPVPSLAALVFVGSLVAQQGGGPVAGAACFTAAMAGAVIGDVAWFSAGRRHGDRVLGFLCRLSLSRDTCVSKTAATFSRRGLAILLLARFIPGLSVVSAPLAGTSGVALPRFVAYAETGAALWVGCGLAAGYVFAAQVSAVLQMMQHFGVDVAGVAAAGTLGYAGMRWVRRRLLLRRLRMARISVDELAAMDAAGLRPVVIDVRPAFQQVADPFRIPGARAIHDMGLAQGSLEIGKLAQVVVYCSCPNEASAALEVMQMHKLGFANVRPLKGGLEAWREAGHAVDAIAQDASARSLPLAGQTEPLHPCQQLTDRPVGSRQAA